MNKNIKEKLANVPNKPGSYQMKNKDGIIIYVGKAKNLKNRLKSYFNSKVYGKTLALVSNIDDFDYIVTNSELEAFILEITLIHKYNPKYNIMLKDDKSYPYIELTNDKYPVLKIIRNRKRKKVNGKIFGPFPSSYSAKITVNIINRLYPLRKCNTLKKDVCLYYHLGQCLGYCKYKVDDKVLEDMKKEIIDFLNGNTKKQEDKLKEEMNKASNNLNFERAKEIKEMLDAINKTIKKQNIDLNTKEDIDIINYYVDSNYISIEILFIRSGLLFGKENKIFNFINLEDDLLDFIVKFYEKNEVPKKVYVNENIDYNLLSNYLNVEVIVPQKGKFKQLLDMALDNAKDSLNQQEEKIKLDNKKRNDAINYLKELLKLDNVSRIESFDNSHLFGTYYVGGMVTFVDFLPEKDSYRKFKLSVDVKDDLSAMREVLYRRYYRVLVDNLEKPDLIVMDGGKTQVGVAKEVLESLGLDIPIIGLVKDDKHKTNKIMNSNFEILDVEKDNDLFLFLTRIQDEVHRYAISYHRNIKKKGQLVSMLDMAPGIGDKKRKLLIKEFGSFKKIKEASIDDLEKVVGKKEAEVLYNYLKENNQ